jgi:hypothetical protein
MGQIGNLKNRGFLQPLYAQSATPKEMVGTVRYDQLGRRWVYCKAGEALSKGKLAVAKKVDATWVNEAGIPTGGLSAGESTFTLTITAAGAAIDENQFRGGVFQINDATGEGEQYVIDSNTAVALNGTSITITLVEPLRTALTTSSEFTLCHNVGYEVTHEQPNTTTHWLPVCIPPINITSGYYFWGQQTGVAPVLTEGTPAIGKAVVGSDAVEGAVKAMATLGYPIVGYVYETGVDGEYKPVNLCIGS